MLMSRTNSIQFYHSGLILPSAIRWCVLDETIAYSHGYSICCPAQPGRLSESHDEITAGSETQTLLKGSHVIHSELHILLFK